MTKFATFSVILVYFWCTSQAKNEENWRHLYSDKTEVKECGKPFNIDKLSASVPSFLSPWTLAIRVKNGKCPAEIPGRSEETNVLDIKVKNGVTLKAAMKDALEQRRITAEEVEYITNVFKFIIGTSDMESDLSRALCIGTLISDQWMLSARHCFNGSLTSSIDLSKAENLYATHSHEMYNKMVDSKDRFDIDSLHFPPDAKDLKNDFVLIKLRSPIHLTDSLYPICLPNEKSTLNKMATCNVTGWGALRSNLYGPRKLLNYEVSYSYGYDCNLINNIMDTVGLNYHFGRDQICGIHNMDDTCQFESGDPMSCFSKKKKRWELTGILSGNFYCVNRIPSIYTYVKKILKWIRATTLKAVKK